MKITGRTRYIQETNQEAFMKGGDFLGAGEFTVKVANVEFNDRENRYFTIVFENNEGKQYKHNQFVPPFQQDYQEKQYIELLSRLGIKLNLPDLTFDTDQLINKIGTIVLKNKFNEEQGKYFVRLSYVKVWNKDDEVVNKPEPKTDEMKQKEQQANGKQTPMSQQSNPFANANGPIEINDDDLPF
ncbi:TPA: single-stranded DNA-binding protein [Staphylococcus aureus]|uniref:single-stranded DNA-binding protein n=1 Tax=Staphylococcus aureus TaxID=1280 RepID=UPI001ABC97CC|nr:single-stranded DNA-binding protein [Staphylococcus aureus]HBG3134618.1 single-stranded DNA-binding protein [Staphylococcus aureus]HDD3719724.1 single-stranded DNA-binding protein [Staphylococcus aureus]HDD4045362.1 single-stranded DNA-binding protein [Staphylococcus aureus]